MNQELAVVFDQLADPRNKHNGRHPFPVSLFIALATGAVRGRDLRRYGIVCPIQTGLSGDFPGLAVWRAQPRHLFPVLRLLNPESFEQWFITFMQQFAASLPPGAVAVDGKTLRRSYDRAAGQDPLHLVNAWAQEQRLCLGQVAVADKSNEITALPQPLELLSLKGTMVTADALHCQREFWPGS